MKLKKEIIMFKKKYLAIATLAMLPVVANAGMTITSTALTGTVQGLSGVDDVLSGAVDVVTGIPYVTNDYITVTYSSALDEGFTPATGVITCTDDTAGDNGAAANPRWLDADAMTIQYNSTSADRKSVDYVITAFSSGVGTGAKDGSGTGARAPADGIGLSCVIAGAEFNGEDMIAAAAATTGKALTVSASSTSSLTGNTKESTPAAGSANAFTVQVAPQFALSSAAAAASASIDVAASPLARGKLKGSGGATINGAGTVATISLAQTTTTSAANNAVVVAAGTTQSLNGDFSWMLKADGTFKTGYSVTVADEDSNAAAVTRSATAMTWPVTKAQVDGSKDFVVTITTDGATTIPATTWTHSGVVAHTNVDAQAQTAAALSKGVGAWTLNGPTVTVYNMPFGSNIDPFLWVSNNGSLEGEISATVTVDGATTGPYALGSAAKLDNTRVAHTLLAEMAAAGETPTAGSRGDVAVTVNANDANISVYGGYKVVSADDRLNLPTSPQTDIN